MPIHLLPSIDQLASQVILIVIFGILVASIWQYNARRFPTGRCGRCGRATRKNRGSVCLECGSTVCRRCGFGLHGNSSGVCPECGLSICE